MLSTLQLNPLPLAMSKFSTLLQRILPGPTSLIFQNFVSVQQLQLTKKVTLYSSLVVRKHTTRRVTATKLQMMSFFSRVRAAVVVLAPLLLPSFQLAVSCWLALYLFSCVGEAGKNRRKERNLMEENLPMLSKSHESRMKVHLLDAMLDV